LAGGCFAARGVAKMVWWALGKSTQAELGVFPD